MCIDDRYFNRNRFISDDHGNTIPMICVLDLLRHLHSIGSIDSRAHWTLRHRLRRSGFGFVLCEDDELWHWLSTTRFAADQLVESAELKIIRQTFGRVDALDLMTEEEAVVASAKLHRLSKDMIERLWSDHSKSVHHVEQLSQWIWRNLVMTSGGSKDKIGHNREAGWLGRTMALRISYLFVAYYHPVR